MLKAITDLVQVKKIIALLMTMCFVYLAVTGKVTSEVYMTVFSMVVSFYFGQSTVRQTQKESK